MWKEYKILFIGFIASVVLIIIFFILQWHQSNLLGLNAKWLSFSAIPILIALFVGGYIKSFKGFGIEVEANLNKPIVKNYNLITKLKAEEVPRFIKSETQEIRRLSKCQRLKIKRLTFIYGRKGYYNVEAIMDYLKLLQNLEYIEIVDIKRKFKYLLKIDILEKGGDNLYRENIQIFINALADKTIPSVYPDRKSTRLNSSHTDISRMPSSA